MPGYSFLINNVKTFSIVVKSYLDPVCCANLQQSKTNELNIVPTISPIPSFTHKYVFLTPLALHSHVEKNDLELEPDPDYWLNAA